MDETPSSVLTRRHVLASVGVALAGAATSVSAAVPGAALEGASAAPKLPVSLKHGSAADWQAMVGHSFRIAGAAGRVKLVAVEPFPARGSRPAGGRDRAFAAVFETAPGVLESDRIHRLSHPLYPTLAIHLAEAAPKRGKARLVAIFN